MVEQGITTAFYLTHPLDALNIRNGGLGIPGAIIGGALGLYWFSRRRKIDFKMWFDISGARSCFGTSHWSMGQLCKSGSLRIAYEFTLGYLY